MDNNRIINRNTNSLFILLRNNALQAIMTYLYLVETIMQLLNSKQRPVITKLLMTGGLLLGLSSNAWANPFYCTANNQYINVGMSASDVQQACGAPNTIQKSDRPAMQRIPVTQYTFNVSTSTTGSYAGTYTPGLQSSAFRVNTGPLTNLLVTVKQGVISQISINGNPTNGVSLCGSAFNVGDPAASATNSCGTPVSTNDSFIEEKTGQTNQVEVWTYSSGDNYQQSFQLTFVNGVLNQTPNS